MTQINSPLETEPVKLNLTAKDFASDQTVKWCAGCGDFSILAQMQRAAPGFNLPKEKYVWVSGIGCSSRFPYYMNTYGFHSIHGRAPAIATGVKLQNPELSVWVATGDGDLLSIGGNHFIHTCRRNVDLKILLFNNQIYALTKGQYSPTSEKGKKTKSTPFGSVDYPFNPVQLALGAGATFVARSLDRDGKHLQEMMNKAAEHKGTAFIEIYQNCVIFNDGAFDSMVDKETKGDNVLVLEHGKPMVFGKANDKGIRLNGFTPEVVDLTSDMYSVSDLWVHDENDPSPVRAQILSQFTEMEGFPAPIGIFRKVLKPTYDEEVEQQIRSREVLESSKQLDDLLSSGNTWMVSE